MYSIALEAVKESVGLRGRRGKTATFWRGPFSSDDSSRQSREIRKAVFIASAVAALACLVALTVLYLERPPLLSQTVVEWSHLTVLIFWARLFAVLFGLGALVLLAPRVVSAAVGSVAAFVLLCLLTGWGIALSTPQHFCSPSCSALRDPAESLGRALLSGLMLPENMLVHPHDYATIFLASLVFFSVLSAFSLRRAAQVTSLLALLLPVSVLLFDRREFGLHAADVLSTAGLGWLTNELLLFVLSAVLVLATLWPRPSKLLLLGGDAIRPSTA